VPNDAVEQRAERRVGVNGTSDDSDEEAPRRTGEVRVVAVEAAVAAGLVEPAPEPEELSLPLEDTGSVPLPDWTDPPTGQVPRVLLGEGEDPDAPRRKGPSWRQSAQDWEQDVDALDFLVESEDEEEDVTAVIAGRDTGGTEPIDPFEFDFETPTFRPRAEIDEAVQSETAGLNGEGAEVTPDDAAWRELVTAAPERRARRHSARPAPARAHKRRGPVAIATGAVLAGVAVGCFEAGPLATLVLAAVALTLAAGETFGALRRAGSRPLSFFGLLATAGLVVFSYLKGPIADPVVLAGLIVVVGACLVVFSSERSPVDDFGGTVLVVTWVGVLGSFAGLLLNPTTFAHRHGVAYLGALVAITVAHDVGSYVVGARFGRHHFVPKVSPGKSVEGLIGGTTLAFLVAGFVVTRIHPFTLAVALGLGAIVVVLAPVGDLVQSVVKRDLGVKDMGHLLPAHGGISDRIDAMLFVLPAAYILFRLVHLG
jgi:phosphatidate cytidylyltransferase